MSRLTCYYASNWPRDSTVLSRSFVWRTFIFYLLHNNLMKIKFTYHTTQLFHVYILIYSSPQSVWWTFLSPPEETSCPLIVASHYLPTPPALATTSLLSVSLNLPILIIKMEPYNMWLLCLASLSVMFSRLMHITVWISTSFHFIAKWCCIIWMYHILFICSLLMDIVVATTYWLL